MISTQYAEFGPGQVSGQGVTFDDELVYPIYVAGTTFFVGTATISAKGLGALAELHIHLGSLQETVENIDLSLGFDDNKEVQNIFLIVT